LVVKENGIETANSLQQTVTMDTPAVYSQGLIEPANGDAAFIINNDDVIASQ